VTVQNSYSLGDRSSQDVLELSAERGISFAPYLPLGWPGAARLQTLGDPLVGEIAARTSSSPAQVALAWLLAVASNVLLIAGTRSLEHLRENIAAAGVELTLEEHIALTALA
jgi:aryl-alcohol dehydrogenase-like predicted oxidoreductase